MADHEYVHGSQDIHEQRATFALFWSLTKWGSVLCVVALVLLAITRTNAANCKNGEEAAKHINACGKLHAAEATEGEAPAEAPAH